MTASFAGAADTRRAWTLYIELDSNGRTESATGVLPLTATMNLTGVAAHKAGMAVYVLPPDGTFVPAVGQDMTLRVRVETDTPDAIIVSDDRSWLCN